MNFLLQSLALHIGEYLGPNLTGFTVQHPKDNCLVLVVGAEVSSLLSPAASSYFSSFAAPMHVLEVCRRRRSHLSRFPPFIASQLRILGQGPLETSRNGEK